MSNNIGSTWRKWDLHIHTPYSKIQDYTDADWDLFFLNLAKFTKQKNISVIGINDYWILDGYYKVLKAWEHNIEFTDPADNKTYDLSHIEQIFPMIEYRSDKTAGNQIKLNIHYLFDPILSTDELKNIISKLYITCNIDKRNEKKNGVYKDIETIDHAHMCVHSDDIKRFEDDPIVKDINYLKAIGYAELDKIKWNEAPTILRESQEIYHFGLLASPKDFLDYKNKTKVRCILHSSDAHQYPNDINNTQSKDMGHCFTWIKGEPSFEGLKYALEDPDSRIKIQESNPFLEKTPPYIKSITFPQPIELTDSKQHSRSITIPQTLHFNRYMNSIIGGRGSGKTTLLEVIKSISDSHEDSITMKEGDNNSERKKILYIPKDTIDDDKFSVEKYLSITDLNFPNKLSITDSTIFKTALFGDIESLNKQITESKTNIKNYSSEQMQASIEQYNNTTKEIAGLNSLKQEVEQLNLSLKQLREINTNLTRLNENQRLSHKLPMLQIDSISDSIIKNTDDINARLEALNKNLENTKEELAKNFPDKNIRSITDAIQTEQGNIQQFNDELMKIENAKERYKNLQDSLSQFVGEYKQTLEAYIGDINSKWDSKKDTHNHKELLTDLKIDIQVILDLDSFTNTLLNDFLNNKSHSYDSIIQDLFGTKTDSQIKNYCDTNSESWIITNSLDNVIIQEFFDMLSRKKSFEDILDFVFESTTKGGDEWDVKTRMLHYVYSFSYVKTKIRLLYKDKPFEVLSAGEKGVISLLINIDTGGADIPLLIDQPEDYLDNNFIHSELIPILQEIKKTRQVIMVSHNANLVVNGDSEVVFVAKNISDESGEFDYISGSLESNTPLNSENFNENQSMKQRICSIMEGGELAFKNRSKKYGIKE